MCKMQVNLNQSMLAEDASIAGLHLCMAGEGGVGVRRLYPQMKGFEILLYMCVYICCRSPVEYRHRKKEMHADGFGRSVHVICMHAWKPATNQLRGLHIHVHAYTFFCIHVHVSILKTSEQSDCQIGLKGTCRFNVSIQD